MSKYLKLFETTADYTAAENTLVKPNVSLIEETNKVEYNPYRSLIIYSASEKLNVTWDNEIDTFGATIKSHTFENGVGIIEFNGNVTKITSTTPYPSGAFSYCSGLTSVTIPNTVTNIGQYAFYQCTNLTSITIPNTVTDIGSGAFSGCTSLPVVDDIRYADTCAVEAVDKTLSAYTIKEGTRLIQVSAFSYCQSLTSITIPDSVTSIGGNTFYYCTNLTSVTIGNSVTSIGESAFYRCTNLTNVTVEATTPPSLEYSAFNNNASGRKIYVPAESVNTYKSASGWSAYANDIEAIATD